ncbi:hypothetical protein SKAU_G00037570 [Synaphobranchus kaupii]|uniref:Uncharacterized protein n=1 Tax=Synaphobranchus kaupii TaxID=118154 RepID=A0A9Q1JHG2_SYNKA|nr:hypothetical protein SKAU_G00037570 [Synaphobranchus kaupii]
MYIDDTPPFCRNRDVETTSGQTGPFCFVQEVTVAGHRERRATPDQKDWSLPGRGGSRLPDDPSGSCNHQPDENGIASREVRLSDDKSRAGGVWLPWQQV